MVEKTIKINVDTGNAPEQLKKVGKGVDKVGDKAKSTNANLDRMTGGAIGKFKGLVGGLKSVALGFKSVGFAIAASGIGLLVLGIAAVTAAFKNSESGQNKFAKIMGVIGSVTGNVIDVVADLGEIIIGLFSGDSEAIKSAKEFGKKIFDVVGLPIKNIIDIVKTASKVIQGLWNDGIDGALTALDDGINDIKGNFTEASSAISSATEALKDFGNEAIREAKIASDIADQRAKADTIERGLIVDRALANRKIAKLRDKAARVDLFTSAQRKEALLEASKVNEQITQKEIVSAKLRRDAIIEENKLSGSNKDDLEAEEQAKARVIQLETKKLNLQKRLGTEIASINNQQKSQAKAFVKTKQDQLTKELALEDKRLKAISDFKNDLDKQNADLDAKTAEDRLALERERAELKLESLVGDEVEKREALIAINELYDQKELELKAENKAKADELKAEQDAKDEEARLKQREDAQKTADEKIKIDEEITASKLKGLDILTQIFGQESALGKASLVAKQAIALQELLIDLGAIKSKATKTVAEASMDGAKSASSVSTGLSATLALGFPAAIPALVGYAGAAVGIISGVASAVGGAKKVGAKYGGGGGSSSSAAQPKAPSFNLVEGTGSNQIAESLQTGQEPIRAFVVSSEVTSSQSLDRNIEDNASI